jgi:RNA polymerase sigma-70 factor, ECF subfamily
MYQQTKSKKTVPSQVNALDALLAEHYKGSVRTAIHILRSKEDSEDAVQTAYCAAFRRFDRFRGESSFKTWITRIVVNCSLMMLRDRSARPHISLNHVERTLASEEMTPEDLCYLAELQAAYASAATKLPKPLHDVYAASDMSQVALPTVADHLGVTTAAAKSRLLRAGRRMEAALQPVIERSAA